MDFSKLLNAIRGNKATDPSAVPKNRSEAETTIPVEVSPTVIAADHPPVGHTSGSVVQSLLGQFTSGRRKTPTPSAAPIPPAQETANKHDDVLASVLPPGSAPATNSTANPAECTMPAEVSTAPIDTDWFEVPLGDIPPPAAAAADVPVLDLPPDVTVPSTAYVEPSNTPPPPATTAAEAFEVQGKIDLTWVAPSSVASFSEAFAPSTAPLTTEGFASLSPHTTGAEAAWLSPLPDSTLTATAPSSVDVPQHVEAFSQPSEALGGTYVAPSSDFFTASPSSAPAAESFSPVEAGPPSAGWGFPHEGAFPTASSSVALTAPATDTTEPTAESTTISGQSASWSDWLIENLDEGLILLDSQGVLQQVNPMAEYLLGAPRQELLGRSLLEVGQQLGGDNAPLWEHLAVTSEMQQFSTNITLPDGQSMMASFVVLELPAHDLWPGGRIIAIRDETRLRAEFAQLMETLTPPPAPASALQVTPEQLTAMRTSLQMVLGFAELLHRGEYGPMNPQQFEMFRNIEHHAKQLAGWIGLPQ
jgi:PAS domain S-box-containing protein